MQDTMTEDLLGGRHLPSRIILWLILCCMAWFALFYEALFSAVNIWYISEIFSHGFFVVPGALYIIWKERYKFADIDASPAFWLILFIVPVTILGVFGRVGGIEVFTHIAAFSTLSLAIWFFLGSKVAKTIWFPLLFILFSIPIGEELVPHLQNVTTILAVQILKWSGIPFFNTGLYIEIPQGKFIVAEACSGIRFFIGSLVFGAVYSHFTYTSFSRKVIFMMLAVLVPIFANAFRVFGIVAIGYFSDMKYATGADHLVYGWFFFLVVLVILFFIGETFKQPPNKPEDEAQSKVKVRVPRNFVLSSSILTAVFTLAFVWQYSVTTKLIEETQIDRSKLSDNLSSRKNLPMWRPIFVGESDALNGQLRLEGVLTGVDMSIFWYAGDKDGAELVSSSNSLFDKDDWSQNSSAEVSAEFLSKVPNWSLLNLVSSSGRPIKVLYTYVLDGRMQGSRIKTKLLQTLDLIKGGSGAGALVAIAARADDGVAEAEAQLIEAAGFIEATLPKALAW